MKVSVNPKPTKDLAYFTLENNEGECLVYTVLDIDTLQTLQYQVDKALKFMKS